MICFAQHPMVPAALLGAGLHDLFRRFDHPDHLRAFGDAVGDRLLDVDVLARRDGVERHRLVPVIGRADHDGIDLTIVENLPVVDDLHRSGPGDLRRLQQSRLVDIAHRDHLVAGQLLEEVHQAAGAAARADHSDADSVVRPLRAACRQAGADHEAGGGGEKCPASIGHRFFPRFVFVHRSNWSALRIIGTGA